MLHPTATKFLSTRGAQIDGKSLLETDNGTDLGIVGCACVLFLKLAAFDLEGNSCSPSQRTSQEFDAFAQTINNYPFLVYAIEHTTSHISPLQSTHVTKMTELLAEMSKSPIRFLLQDWMQRQADSIGIAAPRKTGSKEEILTFKNCVLHCAASQGLTTAVKIALAAGADVESLSILHDSRESAMCLAIMSPPTKSHGSGQATETVVRILLGNGADPNAPTRFKGTPLHYAGKYMREGIMELLLKNHAKPHARDSQDMTPLHRTVIGLGQEGLVRDPQGTVPPHRGAAGAREASLRCVELLVRAGADLRAADNQGHKPIHWAAGLKDRYEIIKFLVETGGTPRQQRRIVNQKCQIKKTIPLHWASGYGNREVVQYLINNGAQIECADERGKTAINWASRFGKLEILEDLLRGIKNSGKSRKAAVNTQEQGGRTALIWACLKGHTGCVKLLLEAGADVNLADGDEDSGGTPLSWAASHGNAEILDLLLGKGAHIAHRAHERRPLLGWASFSGNIAAFKKLRSSASRQHFLLDPDEPDVDGNTPFMLAAARGHAEIIQYLYNLEHEEGVYIDVHHEDRSGDTALSLASGWGRLHIVQWLVETAGLDVNHINKYGGTALHRAANWGRKEVIKYLLSKNAKPDIRDRKGKLYTEVSGDYKRHNQAI